MDQSTKPPRLVLRFALYTAVVLAVAGSAIVLFVRHHASAQAENEVAFHAGFVADAILRDRLSPSDLSAPVTGVRQAQLDRLFLRHVLLGGTLRAKLYGVDGRVTYSTDHSLIGTAPNDRGVQDSLGGETSTRVGSITDGGGQAKVLRAFAPLRVGGSTPAGVLELDQDYVPIARSARKAFLPVVGVLEAVLLILYISLFPILRRVTLRLRRQVQEIEHQAFHDGLTDLPNRALFRERIARAIEAAERTNAPIAVLLLDLDRFKEINDTLGHESGDQLLCAVADRLRARMRPSDTVARLGGDEFCLLAQGADAESALVLAERIHAGMEEPILVGGLQLEVETSIGIAVFPEHGEDVDTLVRHADIALYRSKETHLPTVYTTGQDHYSPERLVLVGELRRALDERELLVYYQPRVNAATGALSAVEALVRWRHPERGLLGPGEFLPLAEHTGLARPLTGYVLNDALSQCRRLRDAGVEIGVAVNLFSRDLLDAGLVDEVCELLAKWRIEPSVLELEITENTILADPTRTREILTRLGERGVRLAIDDFGSGYSSLNYLKRLPVDVLKIDKSFVLNMDADESDAVIVRSTIELGHNLGLEVVAEGVETGQTLARLAELGCDTVQGFHVSRPLTAQALRRWIAGRATGQNSLTRVAAS